MALAILKYLGKIKNAQRFEADIGTSKYFQYKIGEGKGKRGGLEYVDDVRYASPMYARKSLPSNPFQTHFELAVPPNLFDRKRRFIQLLSFKSPRKEAQALSEVIAVRPSIINDDNFKLPNIMLSYQSNGTIHEEEVMNTAFSLREPPVSEAMFFNAILGAIPKLLGGALPAIKKILPGVKKVLPIVKKVADTAGKAVPAIEKVEKAKDGSEKAAVAAKVSPDILKSILEIVSMVSRKNGNGVAKAKSRYSEEFAIDPKTLMELAPILEKVMSPETISAIGDQPVKLFKAISDSYFKLSENERQNLAKPQPEVKTVAPVKKAVKQMSNATSAYSQAQIAPALLAALPALSGLLKKVISPEMVKAIGDQPVKLLKTISDAALKVDKEEMAHLERINPGMDKDKHIETLLASMSLPSAEKGDLTFVNSDQLVIDFVSADPIQVGGRKKVVYDKTNKITLPVKLTPKSKTATQVPKAIFQLIIQDGDSLEVLFEKKFRLKDVPLHSTLDDIQLTSDDLQHLPVNRDLKLELSFIWKSAKKQKTFGTFKNHYICLTDGYLYNRMGQNISQHFALNDLSRYRKFWHKVWEGGLPTHERWKLDFECKYYYAINNESEQIKRLETRKQITSDSAKDNGTSDYRRKVQAKLKSGLEISLEAYNALLADFGTPLLTSEQLSALKGEGFEKEGSQVARVGVEFKGKQHDTASLWIYPEGNVHEVILDKVDETGPTGQVVGVEEETVLFPRFSSVHFVGTKSN